MDLRPAREFPADGAAGEGFTNAAEALSDISPDAVHQVPQRGQGHRRPRGAVAGRLPLLARQDAPRLDRREHGPAAQVLRRHATGDGRLPVQPYLLATVRHRDALAAGTDSTEVAAKEKLNAKYLGVLWQALTDKTPSHPLDAIRARWRAADREGRAGARGRGRRVAGGAVEDRARSAATSASWSGDGYARA